MREKKTTKKVIFSSFLPVFIFFFSCLMWFYQIFGLVGICVIFLVIGFVLQIPRGLKAMGGKYGK